ncbi:hypothetical protein GGX14DRAFT_624010 [Mycena pura]|uniref:RRM domain-containing protein n=1 Tax=Mycena pura TaxID=153505 RepID=A0AAD6VJB6_9AGAR|nr:hypothetical protein GGX14DRAFT_624010 [Mycena pura]
MQAQYRPQPYARQSTFHGPKRQLLGNQAGHAAPAWRTTGPPPDQSSHINFKGKRVAPRSEPGSKIFLNSLPMDVGETEVEELFRKTVGPLRESFLIYNSQGKSKGMAVVSFQRPGDAAIAQAKYDGKIVDGRRPIKIQLIVDPVEGPSAFAPPPTLIDRLQSNTPMFASSKSALQPTVGGPAPPSLRFVTPTQPRRQPNQYTEFPRPATPHNASFPAPAPPRRFRVKKGPKRLKKQWAPKSKSKEQLDKDMEDYRAESIQYEEATG